jgi:glycerol-3-phosphate dehydrogenase
MTRRSRLAVGAGLALYNLLGRDRNRGLPASLHLPPGGLISAQAALDVFPGLNPRGLSGGAIWHDYQARHPDRLNGVVAMAARAAGAHLVNYATAIGPLLTNEGVAGARIRDELTGDEHEIQARATVLAAGAGASGLLETFGRTPAPLLLRAMNVLVDRPGPTMALVAPGRTGRMLTAVPWRAHAGRHLTVVQPDCAHRGAQVDLTSRSRRRTPFPPLRVTRADVRRCTRGPCRGAPRTAR